MFDGMHKGQLKFLVHVLSAGHWTLSCCDCTDLKLYFSYEWDEYDKYFNDVKKMF